MKLYAKPGFEAFEQDRVAHWCPVLTGRTDTTLLDCNPSTSNHGTLTNYSNINTAWIGSQYGTVLDFNGSSNRVVNTLSSNYTFGNRDFSFGGWFWLSATTGSYAPLITTWGNASNQFSGRWFLGLFDGRVRVFDSLGNIAITYISTVGVWNYYLVTKRAGVVTLFVDAMAQGTYSGPNQNWSNDGAVSIGGTSDGFASCRCAEAIVSRSGFTDTQIAELYRSGPGGAWQPYPRRTRSYFAQVLTSYRNRSSRYLCFPG